MDLGEQARQEGLKALAKARGCADLAERKKWLEIADQWMKIADTQALIAKSDQRFRTE